VQCFAVTEEEEFRRKSDVAIALLSQRFDDFMKLYQRDQGAYEEWRRTVDLKLADQGDILRAISPAYAGGKWIVGLIMVGSIAIAVKEFWTHVAWK
jgi:hypothetical protein